MADVPQSRLPQPSKRPLRSIASTPSLQPSGQARSNIRPPNVSRRPSSAALGSLRSRAQPVVAARPATALSSTRFNATAATARDRETQQPPLEGMQEQIYSNATRKPSVLRRQSSLPTRTALARNGPTAPAKRQPLKAAPAGVIIPARPLSEKRVVSSQWPNDSDHPHRSGARVASRAKEITGGDVAASAWAQGALRRVASHSRMLADAKVANQRRQPEQQQPVPAFSLPTVADLSPLGTSSSPLTPCKFPLKRRPLHPQSNLRPSAPTDTQLGLGRRTSLRTLQRRTLLTEPSPLLPRLVSRRLEAPRESMEMIRDTSMSFSLQELSEDDSVLSHGQGVSVAEKHPPAALSRRSLSSPSSSQAPEFFSLRPSHIPSSLSRASSPHAQLSPSASRAIALAEELEYARSELVRAEEARTASQSLARGAVAQLVSARFDAVCQGAEDVLAEIELQRRLIGAWRAALDSAASVTSSGS